MLSERNRLVISETLLLFCMELCLLERNATTHQIYFIKNNIIHKFTNYFKIPC